MKVKLLNFLKAALSVGFVCCLMIVCFSPVNAAEEDIVIVDITVTTFLSVDIVKAQMVISDIQASEFYQPNFPYPVTHSATSDINLLANVDCTLRTLSSGTLVHTSAVAPDLLIQVGLASGSNPPLITLQGNYWTAEFTHGVHNGPVTLVTSIQQDWEAINIAGEYAGTVEVELLEGSL